jgi:hypothetical protein
MKFSRGFKTTLLDGKKWKLCWKGFCKWTGIPGKTGLEILQVIGTGTVVLLLGSVINANVQNATETFKTAFETSKYTHETLERYIDAITKIRTGEGHELPTGASENTAKAKTLIVPEDSQALISTAKAKTLTTLFLLQADPTRRNALLFFLRESKLCCKEDQWLLLQNCN